MMNVACYLVSEGKLEKALLPEELLLGLSKRFRTSGPQIVDFADRSIIAEGVYIPAKGSKTKLIVLPNIKD